ncbi:MAG: MarR family transcriptional regulator [Ignavibacteria bacterium]|nr:MarR family transcriptional regulator [Ignavibacteria bacterium]
MGEYLKKWLKTNKEIPLREEVILNLNVASSILKGEFDKIMSGSSISATQYNVLRILKGVYPEGHPRCEIDARLIDRASDVTRIIDRLEKMGLVKRVKSKGDRRMSVTKITHHGIKLVDKITPKIQQQHNVSTKNLTDEECRILSELLEKLYKDLI